MFIKQHLFTGIALAGILTTPSFGGEFGERGEWVQINDGSGITWSPRAGLQAVNHRGNFFVMGGRTPKMVPLAFGDSVFHNDVWRSNDGGSQWDRVSGGHGAPWDERAYFQAVTKGAYIYAIGGQNSVAIPNPDPTCGGAVPPQFCPPFVLSSTFFNDTWRSKNGTDWEQISASGQWSPRAGLSAVTNGAYVYVMAGSFNDDSAIIGPGGPQRIYYNDVYRSRDGRHWELMTDEAPWAPRAGAIVVAKGGFLYLLGGEDGFVCNPSTPRCPPYFNDVWKSRDGRHWQQVTAAAGWSPRPGHQCKVLQDHIVCFGGFGASNDPTAPFEPANPTDIWVSRDGAQWRELTGNASPPWNATGPADIKYDFAAFAVGGGKGLPRQSIVTFGGDRETFNPFDPEAFRKVDNDVWRFTIRGPGKEKSR